MYYFAQPLWLAMSLNRQGCTLEVYHYPLTQQAIGNDTYCQLPLSIASCRPIQVGGTIVL
jgi:hypothetical protein